MGFKTTLLLATAALGGLLLTACSDDAEALSKAEFVEQADTICGEATTEIDPLWEEFWTTFEDSEWGDPAVQESIFVGMAEVVVGFVPIMEQQVEDLGELAPPEEDAEMLESMLDDLGDAVVEFEEMIVAGAAGDEAARAQIGSDEDPFADVGSQAREYGLAVCGAEE